MKLGLVSAILEHLNFEQVIDFAAQNQLESVEVACWPRGEAGRRYAGVSHIDVKHLDAEQINHIKSYASERGVEISALAYYPNPMSGDLEKRQEAIDHLKLVIKAAKLLDVNMVTTFIGRNQHTTLTENLAELPSVWNPIIELAEAESVRIAIENCPML